MNLTEDPMIITDYGCVWRNLYEADLDLPILYGQVPFDGNKWQDEVRKIQKYIEGAGECNSPGQRFHSARAWWSYWVLKQLSKGWLRTLKEEESDAKQADRESEMLRLLGLLDEVIKGQKPRWNVDGEWKEEQTTAMKDFLQQLRKARSEYDESQYWSPFEWLDLEVEYTPSLLVRLVDCFTSRHRNPDPSEIDGSQTR